MYVTVWCRLSWFADDLCGLYTRHDRNRACAVPTGAELESANSAEPGSKFGSSLGLPPSELGANVEKTAQLVDWSCQLVIIWRKNQIDISYQFSRRALPPGFGPLTQVGELEDFHKNSDSPTPWRKSLQFGTLVGV